MKKSLSGSTSRRLHPLKARPFVSVSEAHRTNQTVDATSRNSSSEELESMYDRRALLAFPLTMVGSTSARWNTCARTCGPAADSNGSSRSATASNSVAKNQSFFIDSKPQVDTSRVRPRSTTAIPSAGRRSSSPPISCWGMSGPRSRRGFTMHSKGWTAARRARFLRWTCR